jgi:hypothetical protein
MATQYEAVVRLRSVDISPEREPSLIALLQQNLPEPAHLRTEREAGGELLISVTIGVVAADSSEVQLEAKAVVAEAVRRAGLTEQAALLDDINIRTGS